VEVLHVRGPIAHWIANSNEVLQSQIEPVLPPEVNDVRGQILINEATCTSCWLTRAPPRSRLRCRPFGKRDAIKSRSSAGRLGLHQEVRAVLLAKTCWRDTGGTGLIKRQQEAGELPRHHTGAEGGW